MIYIIKKNNRYLGIKYHASDDDTPVGTVEPCAGTDTEEPSCGISILDTDGEWIEMKKNTTTNSIQAKCAQLCALRQKNLLNNAKIRVH